MIDKPKQITATELIQNNEEYYDDPKLQKRWAEVSSKFLELFVERKIRLLKKMGIIKDDR